MYEITLKIIIGIFGVGVMAILAGVLYLRLSCQAIQIAQLHDGGTKVSLVSQRGSSFEPENCSSFISIAIE